MSEQVLGIKETKEALIALNDVSLVLIKLLKDGVQVSDGINLVEQLLLNPELKGAISAAVEGISAIPAEIKDLDGGEIAQLIGEEISMVPQVIAALKA